MASTFKYKVQTVIFATFFFSGGMYTYKLQNYILIVLMKCPEK